MFDCFLEFTKREHSQENLLCLSACRQILVFVTNVRIKASVRLCKGAQDFCSLGETFFFKTATYQVNLPAKINRSLSGTKQLFEFKIVGLAQHKKIAQRSSHIKRSLPRPPPPALHPSVDEEETIDLLKRLCRELFQVYETLFTLVESDSFTRFVRSAEFASTTEKLAKARLRARLRESPTHNIIVGPSAWIWWTILFSSRAFFVLLCSDFFVVIIIMIIIIFLFLFHWATFVAHIFCFEALFFIHLCEYTRLAQYSKAVQFINIRTYYTKIF